jgi:hypothetical protein
MLLSCSRQAGENLSSVKDILKLCAVSDNMSVREHLDKNLSHVIKDLDNRAPDVCHVLYPCTYSVYLSLTRGGIERRQTR